MDIRAFRLALTVAFALAPMPAEATPQGGLVTKEQANSLVYEALTPTEKALGVDFDINPKPDDRYLDVTVIPSRGQGVLVFAVDRRTGDVWTTSACLERVNDRLRQLQARVHKQLGLSPAAYAKIKGHGPLCDN